MPFLPHGWHCSGNAQDDCRQKGHADGAQGETLVGGCNHPKAGFLSLFQNGFVPVQTNKAAYDTLTEMCKFNIARKTM